MRKFARAAVLASVFLSTPALAQMSIGVEGGLWQPSDTKFDSGAIGNAMEIDHHRGIDLGIFFSSKLLGPIRSEMEYSIKSASNDRALVDYRLTGNADRDLEAGGRLSARGLMSNFLFDIPTDNATLSFGVGFGGQTFKFATNANYAPTGFNLNFSDKAKGMAVQYLADLKVPVGERVKVGMRYRYFHTPKSLLFTDGNTTIAGKFRSSSLLATASYDLMRAPVAAAPVEVVDAPVQAEAAPQPIATQTCADGAVIAATDICPTVVAAPTGPFMVFFDFDSADITADAAAILDNAASAFRTSGSAQVMLAGHADKSGSDGYNVSLSQRRADAVRAYLASRGVADSAVATSALGESRPLVATADGVREPQNRRVEISYGPGSGR